MDDKSSDKPSMLQADFEELLAAKERAIKKAPVPVKRRQPKITRHKSARQRIAEGQTPNSVRAIYQPEHERAQTPVMPDNTRTTHEVGPGDVFNSVQAYRAGKATTQAPTGYAKNRRGRSSTGRRGSTASFDELMSEYDDI